MKINITFFAFFISLNSFAQQKYVLLDRNYGREAIYTDSISKKNIKEGYFPIYTNQLDSLLPLVGTFKKLGKQGLDRTYFNNDDYKTSSIIFQIASSHHAYGDLYDIDIISHTDQGEYRLKLSDVSQTSYFTDSYIKSFYNYIASTIKAKNKTK